jgi:glucose/arabinose dehydrogenase
MLYIATSGGNAQDGMNLGGKVLRVRDDGSVPNDNPFVGKQGFRPEVYTLGHRNSLGLALNPSTGEALADRETARTAATRSTSSAPARTTAGRS